MKDHDHTGTADQRRTHRRALEGQVSLRFETGTLAGQGDNISRAGLLLYTDQPIRVTVEVEEAGGARTYQGRLIRVQRIGDETTGLAIQFDLDG